MGGLFSPKMPKPLPAPARPVTAVAKTPDIEMADDEVDIAGQKKKKGKKALRTDIIADMGTQTGSTGSGLQIPTGGQ
jgi:hypothetical protein